METKLKWRLKTISEDALDIEVYYKNPLEVSQAEEADFVVVILNGFDAFQDENGRKLPSRLVKKYEIPAQFKDSQEAAVYEDSSTTAGTTSKVAMGFNCILNTLLAGSLSQLWGTINGLQIITYMPLIWIKFPANANSVNN